VIRAAHQSKQRSESRKFPVFSLDNRESAMENSSLVTVPTAIFKELAVPALR